jgi:hypothetical protein
MVIKSLLIALFATSVPVFADTLVSGSVYFDSEATLEEVVKLSAANDNESILKLISSGRVSPQTDSDKDIVVITSGVTPESPAEFHFSSGPTTYWTLTKFVTKQALVEPTPSPAATPVPEQSPAATPIPEQSPAATPVPEQSPTVTVKTHRRETENNDPLDDDNGRRIWHKVDGRWKWYPANKKPVKRALPADEAPRAQPVNPPTSQ